MIANSVMAVVSRLMPANASSAATTVNLNFPGPGPGPTIPRRTPSPADSLRDSGQFTSVSVADGAVAAEKRVGPVPALRIANGMASTEYGLEDVLDSGELREVSSPCQFMNSSILTLKWEKIHVYVSQANSQSKRSV